MQVVKVEATEESVASQELHTLTMHCLRSIQGLAITLDRNRQGDGGEKRNGPKFGRYLPQTIPFQKDAANDSQKMGQRQAFADHLCPSGHAAKRKHES